MKILRPAFCIVLVVFAEAGAWAQFETYNWTTIAGLPGTPGSTDGTNSGARFNFPAGLTVDTAGNIFVADLSNQTLRKIVPLGTNWVVSTIAGLAGNQGWVDGTNDSARLNRPGDVAVDAAGNVLFTDLNHDLRVAAPVGTNWVVTTLAGAGHTGFSNSFGTNAVFYSPRGVDLDAFGNVYIAESANFILRGVSFQPPNWVTATLAGSPLNFGFQDGTDGDALFNAPYDVAVSSEGTVFIADYGNHAIRQVDHIGSDWSVTTISGFSGLMGTNDGPGGAAKFNFPIGIAVNLDGVLFVSDQGSHTIRRLVHGVSNWDVTTIGGAALVPGFTNGVGTAARFNQPFGIAVDTVGNLYVADRRNHVIRKGTPVNSRPILQVSRAPSNQIVVSWPVTATNFVLETKTNIAGSVWNPVTNGIVLQGDTYYYTNTLSGTAGFFRLNKP